MFCECCGRHDAEIVIWNEKTEEYMCKNCLDTFNDSFYGSLENDESEDMI